MLLLIGAVPIAILRSRRPVRPNRASPAHDAPGVRLSADPARGSSHTRGRRATRRLCASFVTDWSQRRSQRAP